MMIFIKIYSVFLAVSSLHPSICLNIWLLLHASLFYHWSMYAFHLAVNERGMSIWRIRGSKRGSSVWRDEQMWERDRKRKTQITADFNEDFGLYESIEQLSTAHSPFVLLSSLSVSRAATTRI